MLVITGSAAGVLSRILMLEGVDTAAFKVVFRGVLGAFITFVEAAFEVCFLTRDDVLVAALLALALEARLGPISTRTTSYSIC
jgi:fluoride ion exporter CrcB/FEX